MTFIVQADTPVANANAYIDAQYMRDVMSLRGIDLSQYTDNQLQVAIIKATEYVDLRFKYKGLKKDQNQDLQWPRYWITNREGFNISGLPNPVKKATAFYAKRALTVELLPEIDYDSSGAAIKRKVETVGPITEETEYSNGGEVVFPTYNDGDLLLISNGYIEESTSISNTNSIVSGSIGVG